MALKSDRRCVLTERAIFLTQAFHTRLYAHNGGGFFAVHVVVWLAWRDYAAAVYNSFFSMCAIGADAAWLAVVQPTLAWSESRECKAWK